MSIARTFKKTVFASAITAILPHVAFAATITVSPSSPDQISLPDATGVVDEILFETNGQTVEKHLGANKDIDKLTVTNGLTLDDQSGTSGKIIFHMSAKEINLGATNYGSAWDNPSSCDNELYIESNTLTANGGTKTAFSLNKGSIVDLDVADKVSINSDSKTAIYLDESSQFDLSAKDIEIVSGVGNSSTSGSIYGISESSFTGKALNNLTVKNSNGGYAIRIYGNANVDLETNNQLSVESALEKTAISISQSDNKNARISLRGWVVNVIGNIEIDGDANTLSTFTANAGTDFVLRNKTKAGSLFLKEKASAEIHAQSFLIDNSSTHEKSGGIVLNDTYGNGSLFTGTFKNSGTINAVTGIHNSRGTFSLTGSTTEQSTLTINGGLAGVVAKNKTTIKDSSLHVNLSWDKAPQDKWGTPIQNNGLMALGAIGNDLSLLNTASEGKSLTITTKNVDVVGQKTSGLLSLMQGNLSIENFAAINVNVN